MNRRSFISAVAGLASFAILPSALTYKRRWVKPADGRLLWELDWSDFSREYECVIQAVPVVPLVSRTFDIIETESLVSFFTKDDAGRKIESGPEFKMISYSVRDREIPQKQP